MSTTATTAPEREKPRAGNNNGQEAGEESRSSFKAALEQIEEIKSNLRDVMAELNEAVSTLKAAEREQKATSKEIQAVRAKLREIQAVEI